jgi:mevalonate kinase
MRTYSAPGKMILFGEHAVVFGKPALAIAIDRRITSTMRDSEEYYVNGHPMKRRHHAYISAALDQAWNGPPVAIDTTSQIPSGSGLGSSAAVSVSCVAALLSRRGSVTPEEVARKAFEVEVTVQGRASPTDTSVSTHGGAVLVSPDRSDGFLWRIEKGERVWNIHHRDTPELTFVVGYTGIHAATGPLVEGVRKLVESSPEARHTVDRIGEITAEGVEALVAKDGRRLGELMSENHSLLNLLGVGHPSLEALVQACAGKAYGAKLTGAGGGGSMIALTDDPSGVADAISRAGGKPFIVKTGCEGVREETDPAGVAKR